MSASSRMQAHGPRIEATAGAMLVAAATLALASMVHFGVVIPLGVVTLDDPFPGARIPEAVIAIVLTVGSISLLARWPGAWWWALLGIVFAIAGTLVGIRVVLLSGAGTAAGDLIYHAGLLAILLVALVLLFLTVTRRTKRGLTLEPRHRGRIFENSISGERIVIRRSGSDTGGRLLVFDHFLPPGGHVPAGHVHPLQEERFTVIEGRMRFRLQGRTILAIPGDSVVIPPGAAHWFGNVGSGTSYARVEVRPALRMEDLFEATAL